MRPIDLTSDRHAHAGAVLNYEGRKQHAESVFARKQLERERQPGAGGGSCSWCLGHTPTECFISTVEERRASARLNISAPRREAEKRPHSLPLFFPSGPSPTCVSLFCLFLLIYTLVPQRSAAKAGKVVGHLACREGVCGNAFNGQSQRSTAMRTSDSV